MPTPTIVPLVQQLVPAVAGVVNAGVPSSAPVLATTIYPVGDEVALVKLTLPPVDVVVGNAIVPVGPAVGAAQGTFKVVPVCEALTTLLQELLFPVTVYQNWVFAAKPLITAEVPE